MKPGCGETLEGCMEPSTCQEVYAVRALVLARESLVGDKSRLHSLTRFHVTFRTKPAKSAHKSWVLGRTTFRGFRKVGTICESDAPMSERRSLPRLFHTFV